MSAVYYKATRPDGTDFHSGKVLYEVGKRVRPLPGIGTPVMCGGGYLHAADVSAETLVGGWWPCRLFEVTGKAAAGFSGGHLHKGGFRQLKVLREVDAHFVLGPNGREVVALIERAGRLTTQEVSEFRAVAWAAARVAARAAAGDAARVAARDAARAAARVAARAAAWAAARDAVWAVARAAAGAVARAAAGDAAGALVVRDLISTEHFDALYGPWAKVIDGVWE